MLLWIVRRHALRNIANDGALAARLAADRTLRRSVRRVELESMTLSAQMELFAASSALLAVHGQAMAWVMFLPTETRRTAAVEIFPAGLRNGIYQELSKSLGTRYEAIRAAAAPGCGGASGKTSDRLLCNVTVGVEKVASAALRMVEWVGGGRWWG